MPGYRFADGTRWHDVMHYICGKLVLRAVLWTRDPTLKTGVDINQWRQSKVPHLLIFLKDDTPESLSWGAVGSGLPNGKNKGALYPGGSRLSTAGAGLTGAEGIIRAEGPRSLGVASSRNSNKSSPPETGVKAPDSRKRAIRTKLRLRNILRSATVTCQPHTKYSALLMGKEVPSRCPSAYPG